MSSSSKNGAAGRMSDSSTSGLEARISARIDSVFEEIGQAYNTVEDRVHLLESAYPSYIKRLGKLEEAIQPYEKYEKKTQDAVNQLSGLEDKVERYTSKSSHLLGEQLRNIAETVTKTTTASLSKKIDQIRPTDLSKLEQSIQAVAAAAIKKTDSLSGRLANLAAELTEKTDVMTKRLDSMPAIDHNQQGSLNATVQALLARVQKLESQASPPSALETEPSTRETALSTNDLAQALINRLAQGEPIDTSTLLKLREIIPPGDVPQQAAPRATYQTPDSVPSTLDQASTRPSVPTKRQRGPESSSVDDSVASTVDQASTRTSRQTKRKRGSEISNVVNEPTATPNQENPRPEKRVRASKPREGARMSLRSAVVPHEEEQQHHQEADEDVRRSARTPKPNKKHESYLTWIEVRDRRKTK